MSGSFLQLLFKSQVTSGVQLKAAFAGAFSIFLSGAWAPMGRRPGLTNRTTVLGQVHLDRRLS